MVAVLSEPWTTLTTHSLKTDMHVLIIAQANHPRLSVFTDSPDEILSRLIFIHFFEKKKSKPKC